MQTHLKLLKHLENHCRVVVEDGGKNYQVFSPDKDSDGNYRDSGWQSSIEEAKLYIGNYYSYTKENLEKCSKQENWKIVEVYKTPQSTFKVGDKVKVLETVKECGDYNDYKGSIKEMKGEVIEIGDHMYGLRYYIKFLKTASEWYGNKLWISSHHLIYDFEEEEEKESVKGIFNDLDKLVKDFNEHANQLMNKLKQ